MSQFSLKMDIADNRFFTAEPSPLFSRVESQKARAFHKKLAGYEPTPLCDLKDLAAYIGVKNILVKDESKRFLITHDTQPASRADMASEDLQPLRDPIEPICF